MPNTSNITHTRRVYSNGEYVDNAVRAEDLDNHIQYNSDFRPGCALIVNGECKHLGYFSNAKELEPFMEVLSFDEPSPLPYR